MRTISVKYPTVTKSLKLGNKVFVLEAIRDLDEAIDIICDAMSPSEQLDPFAEDLCPYFGILWPSAIGLSDYLSQNPELVKGKSVLELGCGLGLPSLVSTHLGGKVLATDFHPDVEEYFQRNCRHSSVQCDYQRLTWREGLTSDKKFDVVLGSDVLYESKHPAEVANGLLKFVKEGGVIILSDPGRAYLETFLKTMNDKKIEHEVSVIPVDEKEIRIYRFK